MTEPVCSQCGTSWAICYAEVADHGQACCVACFHAEAPDLDPEDMRRLEKELEEEAQRNPAVAEAAAQYDATVKDILASPAPVKEEWKRCPHDGGTCHHAHLCEDRCFREGGGMRLTTPWAGYPLPGHEGDAANGERPKRCPHVVGLAIGPSPRCQLPKGHAGEHSYATSDKTTSSTDVDGAPASRLAGALPPVESLNRVAPSGVDSGRYDEVVALDILIEDVERVVHAFSDRERKDKVRAIAQGLRAGVERLRFALSAAQRDADDPICWSCTHRAPVANCPCIKENTPRCLCVIAELRTELEEEHARANIWFDLAHERSSRITTLEADLARERAMALVLEEEQRQMVLMALAALSIERPGWDNALNGIACKMDNIVGDRAQMYDEFRKLRWPSDSTTLFEPKARADGG